jgi:predicted nucleic acid-binding protein
MIFVDTSFWVALRQRRDANHDAAAALWLRHADSALSTTTGVRGETWTVLHRRNGHAAAVNFLDALDKSPRVQVIGTGEDTDRRALRGSRQHDEREYSWVDATSFAVKRDKRIRSTLAFDGHFAAAGFIELRP